jgi:hypothetical protein
MPTSDKINVKSLTAKEPPRIWRYRGCDKDDKAEPNLPRTERSAQSGFRVKLLGGFDFKGATRIQSDIHIHSDPDPKWLTYTTGEINHREIEGLKTI